MRMHYPDGDCRGPLCRPPGAGDHIGAWRLSPEWRHVNCSRCLRKFIEDADAVLATLEREQLWGLGNTVSEGERAGIDLRHRIADLQRGRP